MKLPIFADRQDHFNLILASIAQAADPGRAVRRSLVREGTQLRVQGHTFDLASVPHVFMLAVGKAAVGMAEAAMELLPDHIHGGIIVHRQPGYQVPGTAFQVFHAGHPLPDQASLEAGGALAVMLSHTIPGDLVLCLISGGASAMIEFTLPGIELEALQELTTGLLRSGAPIEDVNSVRKALSSIKAGGLCAMAAPAITIGLILSDVIGDPLPDIGSGLTVPHRVSRSVARDLLERLGLWETAAPSIRASLGVEPASDQAFPDPVNVLLASNWDAVQAARGTASQLGFSAEVRGLPLRGKARAAGERIADQALHPQKDRLARASIYGGETTVRVTGEGLGGRNQELALAAAIKLDGKPGIALMAYATDGVDGPTNAAGAIVDGETCSRIRAQGIDPEQALSQNDSYHALDAAGCLIRSGPTGTNLNDVAVMLEYGSGQV